MTPIERFVGEIATRMATVTVATGSRTDIGINVRLGTFGYTAEDVPLSVVQYSGDKVIAQTGNAEVKVLHRFSVEAVVECSDPLNPHADGYAMIHDIKRAIFGTAWSLPNGTRFPHYVGCSINVDEKSAGYVSAAVDFTVETGERLGV